MALDSVPGPREKNVRINLDKEDPVPMFLLIKRESGDFNKVSPFLITRLIKSVVGDVKIIRKIKDGLLVEVKTRDQSRKLLETKTLGDYIVTVTPHNTLNSCKGVIYCKDLVNCTTDEILTELKSEGVTQVRRIISRKNGCEENTPSLVLTFNSRDVPKYIYAAMYRLPVRPYIPNPLRCFNCQQFGHSSSNCKNPKLCVCGKPSHEEAECGDVNCINCKGNHPPSSRNCPKFKLEYAVLEYKTINKCSFTEARQHVQVNTTFTNSYANVAAKPVSPPPPNITDIASLLLPEITKIVKSVFSEFVQLFTSQVQTKSPTALSNESTPNTSSIKYINMSSAITGNTTQINIPTPHSINHPEMNDSSSDSTTNAVKKKIDRRGWPKGKPRT